MRSLSFETRRWRSNERRLFLRSNADPLVPRPVGCILLLGVVLGFEATGAGIRGRDGAAGKGAVGGRFSEGSGFRRGLAIIHL